MIHLSRAEAQPRVNSFYRNLSREVIYVKVVTPGLLREYSSCTNGLQNRLLVLDLLPGLLHRINLKDVEVELAGDHR